MLRQKYYYKNPDTFPYVKRDDVMKSIEENSLKADRDNQSFDELMNHLTLCAEEQMKDPGFESSYKNKSGAKRKDVFHMNGIKEIKWVNLKEIRD